MAENISNDDRSNTQKRQPSKRLTTIILCIYIGIPLIVLLIFAISAAISEMNPPHYHSRKENILRQPTCTEYGEVEIYCDKCDDYRYVTKKDPLGHSWVQQSVVQKATCYQDGSATVKCSTCGQTSTERLPAKHDLLSNRQCFVCGHVEPYPQLSIGTSKTSVLLRWGEPLDKSVYTSSYGTTETWWYKEGSKTISVRFDTDGLVSSITKS